MSFMYNPFPLLNRKLLEDKIEEGKKYFVRQNFPRGYEAELKCAFLFRAYSEEEKERAIEHYEIIKGDRHAFLYDATVPEHMEKLLIAANQPKGYRIYYAGKTQVEWTPPDAYQQKMRKYLVRNHPGWKTQKNRTQIEVWLQEEFGHLFLKFIFEGEEERIPFDQIEMY